MVCLLVGAFYYYVLYISSMVLFQSSSSNQVTEAAALLRRACEVLGDTARPPVSAASSATTSAIPCSASTRLRSKRFQREIGRARKREVGGGEERGFLSPSSPPPYFTFFALALFLARPETGK